MVRMGKFRVVRDGCIHRAIGAVAERGDGDLSRHVDALIDREADGADGRLMACEHDRVTVGYSRMIDVTTPPPSPATRSTVVAKMRASTPSYCRAAAKNPSMRDAMRPSGTFT